EEYTPGEVFEDWDLGGLATQADQLWPLGADLSQVDATRSDREAIASVLTEDALSAYDRREQELGAELMRYLERQILLQIIDLRWREHLYEMDYLREGIHLRGFAQIDPLVAYKNEGFTMFHELMNSIWEEFARVIYHVEVNVEPADFEPGPEAEPAELQYAGGGPEQPSAIAEAAGGAHPAARARAAAARPSGAAAGAGAVPMAAGDGSGNGQASDENPATVVKS